MRYEDRYGTLDRWLHDLAFASGRAQRALADIETALFRKTLEPVVVEDPVFLTGLPRSGTTILLELLVGSGRFASHTYRDMPFVLCPMLWWRFRRRFEADPVAAMERAHGDGLRVSADSPEAFEEIVWKAFWPDHYVDDRIRPWTADERNREFVAFFEDHMRKVIVLRREHPAEELRYVSKNNANLARLAAPPGPLGAGTFLVPFREPLQQAASMLRQHRRFSRIHEENDFLRRYMEGAGHHEFGAGLRPVDFDGWLEDAPEADTLEFWVRYWIAAYGHVLEHRGGSTRILSYDRLVRESREALGRLAGTAGVPASSLVRQADRLRPPRQHEIDDGAVSRRVRERARAVHEELRSSADV